jgi:hypothetical protein
VKAYLVVTAALFGLLTIVHVWRIIVESSLAMDPWFWLITVISTALCLWGFRLLAGTKGRVEV